MAAVAVVLVGLGLAVALGGSGGDDQAAPASGGSSSRSVDISDLDDPTTTGDENPTTTVATVPGERVRVTSDSGISWTMASTPEQEDVVDPAGGSEIMGGTWSAAADDRTTEVVQLTDLRGQPMDAGALFADFTSGFDGELSDVSDSHIATATGGTASFEGTDVDGNPVVAYLVAAQVEDQALLVVTVREDDVLADLYLDFLALPSTVDLA